MSNDKSLADIYTNDGVRAFGQALRFALRDEQSPDFASLVELEYVESKEGFAEVIKKFLRRYETQARRREERNQATFHPNERHLESLMAEVDRVGVRSVRAALIARALVYSSKKQSADVAVSNESDGGNDNG